VGEVSAEPRDAARHDEPDDTGRHSTQDEKRPHASVIDLCSGVLDGSYGPGRVRHPS
jgi:hypothetical protein